MAGDVVDWFSFHCSCSASAYIHASSHKSLGRFNNNKTTLVIVHTPPIVVVVGPIHFSAFQFQFFCHNIWITVHHHTMMLIYVTAADLNSLAFKDLSLGFRRLCIPFKQSSKFLSRMDLNHRYFENSSTTCDKWV